MTDYRAMAQAAAQANGIDPNVFINQIQQESGFNPNAKSAAGAEGIAQFMPSTAASMGVDPWNPQQSLYGAAKYDANNLKKYQGDYEKMLAAYNAGGGSVDHAVSAGGSKWLTLLPSETQNYVKSILSGTSVQSPAATETSPSTGPSLNIPGIGDIGPTLTQWGEYTGIFLIALFFIGAGFYLMNQDKINSMIKSGVKTATEVAAA